MTKPIEAKFDHVDLLYPSNYLKTGDLMGRQVVVVIESVEARHSLKSARGEEKKPVLRFVGKKKAFVMNKTNAKRIAALYGPKPSDWVGKPISLHAESVDAFGEIVEAIRVVQQAPQERTKEDIARVDVATARRKKTQKENERYDTDSYGEPIEAKPEDVHDAPRELSPEDVAREQGGAGEWDDVGPPPMGDDSEREPGED